VSSIITGVGSGNPEVAVLRKDVEAALAGLSTDMGKHIGQLYSMLDMQLKAMQALDARLELIELFNKQQPVRDTEGVEL
jgi:hypothetical protein